MFNQIDNIPNTSLYNQAPQNLGTNTNTATQIKPHCEYSNKVASFSETENPITPTTIINNGNNGYDTISLASRYASAFDELGYPDDEDNAELLDNKKPVDPNEYMANLVTHIYVGSLSIIGLFALYRMIQKTR
jgi:hypothetical protein